MNGSLLDYPKHVFKRSGIDRVANACLVSWFGITFGLPLPFRGCGYWGGIFSGVIHCGTPRKVVNAI